MILTALSPREAEVAALVAAGLSNKEIAHRLALTEGTIKTYLSRQIFRKLHVGSRTELAVLIARELSHAV